MEIEQFERATEIHDILYDLRECQKFPKTPLGSITISDPSVKEINWVTLRDKILMNRIIQLIDDRIAELEKEFEAL